MVKIQNISGIHSTLGFPEFDILENYRKSFHESELGRLHSLFPFDYMTKSAGLSDRHLGIGGDIKRFDSTDGIHEARMLRIDGLRSTVELGMIDVERIDRGDGYWFLDTGVPHYVEFTDDLEAVDVIGRGRRIRYDKRFAKGTNVNFVKVVGPGHIAVRTYERGVEDETLACGTGSTAAALVTHLAAQPSVTAFRIDVRGGRLSIAFDEPKPGIYTRIRLSGEARKVFEGSYDTANFQS